MRTVAPAPSPIVTESHDLSIALTSIFYQSQKHAGDV